MIDPVALSTYSPTQVQSVNAAPSTQALPPAQQAEESGALRSLVSSEALNPREAINPSIFQNTLNQANEGLLSQLRSQTLSTASQGNFLGRTSLFDLFRSPIATGQSAQISQFNAVSEPSTRRSLLDVTA